jgi:hypothetical protein
MNGFAPEKKPVEEWVLDQVTVLAEAFNEPLTAQRMEIYAKTLTPFGKENLEVAFARALREKKFFPKIAELIELAAIDPAQDGRPGAEEAWQMCPRDEFESVVWTAEMAVAFVLVRLEGDRVAARMAFREKYQQLVAEARSRRQPVIWSVSLGWDGPGRVAALTQAVAEGKISLRHAEGLLGEHADELRNALAPAELKALAGEVAEEAPDTSRLDPVQKALRALAETKSLPSYLEDLEDEKPKSKPDRRAIQQAAALRNACSSADGT